MTQAVPPILSVTPSRALVDEKFQVLVENLPPGCPVTLRSLHRSEDEDDWEAYGHYVSDHRGVVSGPGPFPALLDMWGGGAGLLEYRSALLASRGYVSFSLDYLRSEHLSADVEFKYFETAFNIIRNHPQVIPDRVGILGSSLGSMVAFDLTAYSTIIKPRCIVCISSNHYHPPGTTLKAGFKILSKHFHKAHFDENNYMSWRSFALDLIADPSNNVEVGRINCPMLLVNGCDDQNWPTVETAEEVARLLREGGKEHLLSRLAYPGAGHLIEPPFSPHFRATKFIILNSKEKVILLWGGHTKPHSDAQEDSWRKILSFLQLHLYHSPSVKANL